MEYHFGRLPSPFDARDYRLANYIPRGAIGESVYTERKWDYPIEVLDQKNTPHCVGFSMANFGINLPTFTPYTNQDGHDFYYKCKILDGEPGKENGSYIRSAMKVLRNDGIIDSYAFAPTLAEVKWWLLNKGPIISGTLWLSNMLEPDSYGVIHATGESVGGHAIILNEWKLDADVEYIGIKNSWGPIWGNNGKAYISAEDYAKLLYYNGEAATAVELASSGTVEGEGCLNWLFKLFGL